MKAYLDASVLIAAIINEPFTAQAHALMAESEELCASEWVLTEAVSGIAIKQRTGALTEDQRGIAQQAVENALESMTLLPISPRHFRSATRYIQRSDLPLRGGDALHLAVAQASEAILWTLDRELAKAGRALAIDTRLLG